MAIVLALLITGWLVAFALGSQTGFDNKPVPTQQSPKVKSVKSQSTTTQSRTSAA